MNLGVTINGGACLLVGIFPWIPPWAPWNDLEHLQKVSLVLHREQSCCGRERKLCLDPSFLWTKALNCGVCVYKGMDTITLRVLMKSCHFWSKGTGKHLLTPGKRADINAGFRSNPEEGWDHWEGSVIQCLSKTKS